MKRSKKTNTTQTEPSSDQSVSHTEEAPTKETFNEDAPTEDAPEKGKASDKKEEPPNPSNRHNAPGAKEKRLSYSVFREAFRPATNPFLPDPIGPKNDSHPKGELCVFNTIGDQARYVRERAGENLGHVWSLTRDKHGNQRLRPGIPVDEPKEGLVLTEAPWDALDQVVDL